MHVLESEQKLVTVMEKVLYAKPYRCDPKQKYAPLGGFWSGLYFCGEPRLRQVFPSMSPTDYEFF